MQGVLIDHEAALKRLAGAYGASSDTELASRMGVSRSTLSSWRSRGGVPAKEYLRLASRDGLSLEWVINGRGPKLAALLERPKGSRREDLPGRLRSAIFALALVKMAGEDAEKKLKNIIDKGDIDLVSSFVLENFLLYQQIAQTVIAAGFSPEDIESGVKAAMAGAQKPAAK